MQPDSDLIKSIIHKHDIEGKGFRRTAKELGLKKSYVFNLYKKYAPQYKEQIENKMKADPEYQRLKSKSVDLKQEVQHYKALEKQQREIEDLLLRKAETDEGLKDIFSSQGSLWGFASSVARKIDVWSMFLAYCKSRKLEPRKRLFEAVGALTDFEDSIRQGGTPDLANHISLELEIWLDEAEDEERKATFQKKFDDIIKNFRCGDCGRGFESMVIVLPDRDKYTRILCPCGSPYKLLCPADCQARLNFQVDGTHWKCPKCGLVLERTKLIERDWLDKIANELNP